MRRTALLTLLALPAALAGVGVAESADAKVAAAAPTGLRDVMFVGNNWAGTASIVDARTPSGPQARGEPDPRQGPGARRHPDAPRVAWRSTCHPAGAGRGARPVRRRHVHHEGRPLPRGVAGRASPTSSGSTSRRPSPAEATASSASSRWTVTAPTTWASRPTATVCWSRTRPQRQVIEYSMVDEPGRRRADHDGRPAASLRVRRDAAREQLLRRRQPGLPRLDRQGLHAGRRDRVRPVKIGPLHDALKGDRWFQIVRNAT